MSGSQNNRWADFFYEAGTMRKIMRAHRQVLLTDDLTDNIATHSYRVTLIGWVLAKIEQADPYKVVMMCLLHDFAEIRTNDHNWVHKPYIKNYDDEIRADQLDTLPDSDLSDLSAEYDARESKEAIIAKEADILDQILLLREYEWQGNKEAALWLRGKNNDQSTQIAKLTLESAKALGRSLYERDPSDWWREVWTDVNRKD